MAKKGKKSSIVIRYAGFLISFTEYQIKFRKEGSSTVMYFDNWTQVAEELQSFLIAEKLAEKPKQNIAALKSVIFTSAASVKKIGDDLNEKMRATLDKMNFAGRNPNCAALMERRPEDKDEDPEEDNGE